MTENNLTDFEDSRKRTYYYCDNPIHKEKVRQTYFTEPEKYDAKCLLCGAVMTIGRYSDSVESGTMDVNGNGQVLQGNDRFEDGIDPDPDDWENQSKTEGL